MDRSNILILGAVAVGLWFYMKSNRVPPTDSATAGAEDNNAVWPPSSQPSDTLGKTQSPMVVYQDVTDQSLAPAPTAQNPGSSETYG